MEQMKWEIFGKILKNKEKIQWSIYLTGNEALSAYIPVGRSVKYKTFIWREKL